jgi:hypothetical protein
MPRLGAALDTLRWGDSIPIVLVGAGAKGNVSSGLRQIVKAQWRWPLLWAFRPVISVQSTDPTAPQFVVTYTVTIGSGQNSSDIPFEYTMIPSFGVYPTTTDFIELPASDIQIVASVFNNNLLTLGQQSVINVGAYLAPVTEPHAMTELLEHVQTDGADHPGVRWMTEHHGSNPSGPQPGTGQGFPVNPDPLYYQRR